MSSYWYNPYDVSEKKFMEKVEASQFQPLNSSGNDPSDKVANFWSSLGRGFSNLWKRITGSGLTDAEKEANRFSAQQAELAFERESDFYDKYQSISAQVNQMREAGINPFSTGGSVSSSGGVSSSSPSSVSPATGGSLFNPLDFVLSLMQAQIAKQQSDADIRLKDADVNLKNAEANNLNQRTPLELSKLMSEISELDQRAQLHVGSLEKVLNESKTAVKSLDLTDKQLQHFDALINKLNSEVKTIDGIRDTDKRIKVAEAAIAEFESSIANLVSDLSNEQKVSIDDFVVAFAKILLTKFVGK